MSEAFYHFPTARPKFLSRQQQNALDVLRAAGSRGATGAKLQAGGAGRQYPMRIKELKDDYGFGIPPAKYVGKADNNSSIYRYTLQSEPHCASKEGTSGPPAERKPPGMAFARPLPEGTGGTLFDIDPDGIEEGRSAITGQPMRTSTGWVKRVA